MLAVLFVFSIFGAQLLKIQALDAKKMATAALGSRLYTVTVPAMRGDITDTNGVVLATSIERRNVTADQTAVPEYQKTVDGHLTKVGVAGAAEDLAPLTGKSVEELTTILTGTRRFTNVAKGLSPLTWRRINELGIPGIYSEPTSQRTFLTSTAAASLVGFVGGDGTAGGGLELLMNRQLSGKPGTQTYERARDGRMIPTGEQSITPAVPGHTVQMTINSDLQWFAQNAIAQKVQQTKALSGTVIVQNVHTGELLAVASYPTFDPNNIATAKGNLDNRAFDEVYEPGSTGKVMTFASVLQEGVANPETPVTVPGTLPRAGTTFHDSHAHGIEHLTAAGVLAQSRNIGTIELGEKVPAATLHSYFTKFGVGQSSGIGFPGESPGLLTPVKDWSGSQRYTVMFGQGLSVNAIQATSVYATIANQGVRVTPNVVKGFVAADGTFTAAPAPTRTQVVSPETAKQVSEMMESVVSDKGTAAAAEIPGYRVAGKTGTANRFVSSCGGYCGYTASFIGYAPADSPQLVMGVFVEGPQGSNHFGGSVAAP
ncbi:MAG: peptidoglycan D,D-transpeptidase FtsI family protein, partial [Oryzihumus sp.]